MSFSENRSAVLIHMLAWRSVPERLLEHGIQVLSDSERERYNKIRFEPRRGQYLTGHLLARFSISQLTGIKPQDIELIERPELAPQIVNHDGGVSFNLSHSGDWVACAVSVNNALSLDIERLNPTRDFCVLAEHQFDETDLNWFHQQDDKMMAFYRLWCIREARFKLNQAHLKQKNENIQILAHSELMIAVMTQHPIAQAPTLITVGPESFF